MKKPSLIIAALIALIAVIGALPLALPRDAAAQDSITVVGEEVENLFPDGLLFHIDVASASQVEEIRVYVRKLGQSTRTTYRTVEFEPGGQISGTAHFRSKTANEYIPTGTRLEYYYDIRTADGSNLETEPKTFVYLNTGLDWHLKSSGLIDVYYYSYDDLAEARAEAVLAAAVNTYEYMGPILGVELTEPMSVVVYSDYRHMREALRPSSRVAATQLRTVGQAFSNERTLLVDGSLNSVLTTTAHEFTHLLVADAAGSAYLQVHKWLNEGLAVYSEREPNNEYERYIGNAIHNDQVPPLTGLRTFAGTPRETLRNYGQGHSVVSYMLGTYGPEPMAELFANLRETHNLEKALAAAYGLTIDELDNEWRESVGLAYREMATPALPPLQVLPTRRPTPTSASEPAGPAVVQSAGGTATAAPPTPTAEPAPTYTPAPTPTAAASAPSASGGGCGAAPASSGPVSAELASLALLAGPAGLLALAGARRSRAKDKRE